MEKLVRGKILVTGANGYLGRYLVSRFSDNGEKIIALCRRKKDMGNNTSNIIWSSLEGNTLENVMGGGIDTVIHTAVAYGRNAESNTEIIDTNIQFPIKILECCKKYGVKIFMNTDTILDPRLNMYASTKHYFADLLQFYQNDMCIVNIRLDHFYGPHEVRSKFLGWLIDELSHEVPYLNFTKGDQVRNFIHIDDVVSAYLCVYEEMINNYQKFIGQKNEYIVCGDYAISIYDLAWTVKRILGNTATQLKFGVLPKRKYDPVAYNIDSDQLKQLGWAPKYSIIDGLKNILGKE